MKILIKLTALTIDTITWFYPFGLAMAASVLATLLIDQFFSTSSIVWVVATLPLFYLLWLFLFISLGIIGATLIFIGFQKPASLNINLDFATLQDLRSFIAGAKITTMYRMQSFSTRLPILNYSLFSPIILRWLNVLVSRAYAPSVHIGKNSLVLTRFEDPDLTHVGRDVVIGAHCQLVCHALNTSQGYFKYSSAPIYVGDSVTIGGNSRIGMGVKIDRGAVVEVSSNVLPFTRIAPYEVWGGNPAQLLRRLDESPVSSSVTTAPPAIAAFPPQPSTAAAPSTVTAELNRIIAKALRMPVEQVTDDLNSGNCADWDSLAKMAIAAALFDQFELRLAPHEIATLNSRLEIQRLLDERRPTAPATASDAITSSAVASVNPPPPSELDTIIAKALRMPVEQITDDLNSANCADWDSLAKMAIAAALFDQFGVRLTPTEIAQLNSRPAIQTLLHQAIQPEERQLLEKAFMPPPAQTSPDLLHDPELLPLGDIAENTRLLAQHLSRISDPAAKQIHLSATFTVEPLSSALELWCQAFKVPVAVASVGFNQVEESLLSPSSPFRSNPQGLNIVLVRPEDLISDADSQGQIRGQQIIEAIRHYAKQHPGLVVANLPPATSVFFRVSSAQVLALRNWWQSQLVTVSGIRLLDFAGVVENLGLQQSRDTAMEVVTRAPYAQTVYQHLGVAIARLVRQTYMPAKKVIALDCDNTLWGGVIGEDGLNGIALGDDHPGRSFKLFQQALLDIKARGVLLVLVSKNEADDVWQVFDQHPDMLLKRSDIAAHRINWQPKSNNLRSLAQELNLGIDAFVFADDSPNERLEVSTNAPAVTVMPMPSDPTQYVEILGKLWCFEAGSVTAEDAKRTAYMQQEQQRQQLQSDEISLDRYLEALQLKINIRPASDAELPRVAQLTQKTNQFNLSLIRRSLTEIQTLPQDHSIWVLDVTDRFGDYGLVGIAIVKPDSNQLLLDTFLMSCRALGRGVETAFIARLFDEARQKHLTHVSAPFVSGPRNAQVKTFLLDMGFQADSSDQLVAPVDASPAFPSHIAAHASA
ncbi:MAG: HAD-IIIC family phosphatase [Leptolyngbya sp. SIOISBB]|nr:HAD-IIIC family phosphatase [Leptolyngbya sp. SIOISBB]